MRCVRTKCIRIKRTIFCRLLLLSILLLLGENSVLSAAQPKATAQIAPRTFPQARSWILMDAATGRVLAEHKSRQRMFPASTTKTMTALVALSQNTLDRVVRIGPNPPLVGESSVYLMQGEQFVMRDLLRASMIKSANDASAAIAEGVAGSVPAFVELMNKKAREIGALDTNFVNPHGLHDPNHYTTARDLALIARAAMRYPFFNEIVSTKESTIHGNWKLGENRLLFNRNRLLLRWAQCDGVKTGYTKQAGRCLIASATRHVRTASGAMQPFRLISVVLFSPDTWADSRLILENLGFSRFSPTMVTRAGEDFGPVAVVGGASQTHAITPRAIGMALRHDENAAIQRRVHLSNVKAPLRAGQSVGYVEFLSNGHRLAQAPLVAREAVAASVVARVLPPMAPVLPANRGLRWAMYGAFFLSLALLLSVLKLRAQSPPSQSAKAQRKTSNQQTEYSIYGQQPQISQSTTPHQRRKSAKPEVESTPAHRTAEQPAPGQRSSGRPPEQPARDASERTRAARATPTRTRSAPDESPEYISRQPDSRRPSSRRIQSAPAKRRTPNESLGQRDESQHGNAQRKLSPRGQSQYGSAQRSDAQHLDQPQRDGQTEARQHERGQTLRRDARAQRLDRQARERRAQSEQAREQLAAWQRAQANVATPDAQANAPSQIGRSNAQSQRDGTSRNIANRNNPQRAADSPNSADAR